MKLALKNIHVYIFTPLFGIFISIITVFSALSQNKSTDTIPWNSIYFKSGSDGIIETRAEKNYTIRINEIMASNSEGISDEFGEQDDWFEIYNYGDEDVILNGLYFTDSENESLKWQFDATETVSLPPGEFKLFWADGTPEQGTFHTNFKLSADGEYVGVFTEEGTLIDQVKFEKQTTDVSFGRFPDGAPSFYFNIIATPEESNSDSAFIGILPMPETHQNGGLFNSPQTLKLSTFTSPNAIIRYSTDSNEPSQSSPVFPDSLVISETTIFRAKAFKQGYAESPTLTISFIFEKDSFQNPVISLVSDEKNFTGTGGLFKSISQDIEIPAHFEMFVDNQEVYRSGAGIQLHSPKASTHQYSMRLYARGAYGNSWFSYPFFNSNGPDNFKRLILRNAGNDNVQLQNLRAHLRDQIIQRIAKNSNVRPIVSESKVVNVFINGEFFGIYNLRERIDEYFIESHTGVSENFDLLERAFGYKSNQNAIVGSFEKFQNQVGFLDNAPDKNLKSTYDSIQSMFDLENFRDYWITQVYFGNYDWLSNNVKYWCSEDGKWQWIYWDLDHGFGLPYRNFGDPDWNTLAWSLGFSDRAWGSGYNNRVARNLLENDDFRTNFIQRFTYFLNTQFSFEEVKEQLDSVATIYRNDLPTHLAKWDDDADTEGWEKTIDSMANYAKKRPDIVLQHLKNKFNLSDPVSVNIKVEPAYAGSVHFSTGNITNHTFEGVFFPEMKYILKAKPIDGYEFVGWKNVADDKEETEFNLNSDTVVAAIFQATEVPDPLVINEVFYNNNAFISSHWIEIVNTTHSPVDISGFQLEVNEQKFLFKERTIINAEDFLVIVNDIKAFQQVYKNAISTYAIPTLQLSEAYSIKILDHTSKLMDYVIQEDSSKIATLRLKSGFSLELNATSFDNLEPKNWGLSDNTYGTPGLSNETNYKFSPPLTSDFQIPFAENQEMVTVQTFQFPFDDMDEHSIEGIAFQESPALSLLSINGKPIISDSVYRMHDSPFEWKTTYDSVAYQFAVVDASGMASSLHTLAFAKAVGINQQEINSITVSPVPAKNFIVIDKLPESNRPIQIYLWNVSGILVKEFKGQSLNSNITLPVSDVENGVYILQLKGAEFKTSLSVIIQR